MTSPFSSSLQNARILVVDDEPGMRNFLVKTLQMHCHMVQEAANAKEATDKLDQEQFDLVILDNIMPGLSGIDWLQEQREIGLFSDAILITAYAELETVIEALRAGAVDFLIKPFRANQILNAVSRSLDNAALRRENNLLRHELQAGPNILRQQDQLVGSSPEIAEVKDKLQRFANIPSNVLITGESGVGKEVAARMLHAISDRADKPFVYLSCASGAVETFEEDLFGRAAHYAQGHGQKEGLLLSAQGGSLFLDDVDELSTQAQIALLKVIEAQRVRPIGASRDIPLDIRFIFATTKHLEPMVEEGSFRRDLYYRLNVLNLHLPPLKDRPADIMDLTEVFLDQMKKDFNIAPPEITSAVRTKFLRYEWPGNVRELRNHIERSMIHDDLEYGLEIPSAPTETDTLAAVERRHILDTLQACNGNRAEAARRLGVSRKTIDRKCRSWDI
ncbi:MAG: sigma-54 dependent transcriptional regulator [Cohaesibacter sp.]|nr:sigma-54 dependent transcriptional regulator [Cohaesibacter sp.]